MSKRNTNFIEGLYKIDIDVKITEMDAVDENRELSPQQRGCRYFIIYVSKNRHYLKFSNENNLKKNLIFRFSNEILKNMKVYSRNYCLTQCRAEKIILKCNCLPFYYSLLLSSGMKIKNFKFLIN